MLIAVALGLAACILLWALYKFEQTTRKRNTEDLVDRCSGSTEPIHVMLVASTPDCTEDAAAALYTLFQNAKCPRSLRVTLVESVTQLLPESPIVRRYASLSASSGRYTDAFLDLVRAHQAITECPMTDALASWPREVPWAVLATETSRFTKDWDSGLLEQCAKLQGSTTFGGIFLGSLASGSSGSVPAYTAIGAFDKTARPYASPVCIWRPLLRVGPAMPVLWASLPMLLSANAVESLRIPCKPEDLELELSVSGFSFWTAERPVAHRSGVAHRGSQECNYRPEDWPKDRLLGISTATASALEIVAKFGSVSNLHWSLSAS